MKSVKCRECGKKYKHISRTTLVEEDGRWEKRPICRPCWDGVILVSADDLYESAVCDECGGEDCAVTKAVQDQLHEDIVELLKYDYPSATIYILPKLEWATKQACCWQPSGYMECRDKYYRRVGEQWEVVDATCTAGGEAMPGE